MTDWVTFEGRIEPVAWGRAAYTVLRLPPAAVQALGRAKRVEGEIAEHPVNLGIARAPVVDGPFLWAGQTLLERIGIEPGEILEVRLKPAPDDRVDLPDDVATALRAGGVRTAWDALSPGRRRSLLYQVDTARTAPTRAKRIQRLLDGLSEGSTAD